MKGKMVGFFIWTGLGLLGLFLMFAFVMAMAMPEMTIYTNKAGGVFSQGSTYWIPNPSMTPDEVMQSGSEYITISGSNGTYRIKTSSIISVKSDPGFAWARKARCYDDD